MPIPEELYEAFARTGDTSQDVIRAPYDYERQNESANWLADLLGMGPVMRGTTRGEEPGASGLADALSNFLPIGKAGAAAKAGLGAAAGVPFSVGALRRPTNPAHGDLYERLLGEDLPKILDALKSSFPDKTALREFVRDAPIWARKGKPLNTYDQIADEIYRNGAVVRLKLD